jgi:hypothetical protein
MLPLGGDESQVKFFFLTLIANSKQNETKRTASRPFMYNVLGFSLNLLG